MTRILSKGPEEVEKFPFCIEIECPDCHAMFALDPGDEWTAILGRDGKPKEASVLCPNEFENPARACGCQITIQNEGDAVWAKAPVEQAAPPLERRESRPPKAAMLPIEADYDDDDSFRDDSEDEVERDWQKRPIRRPQVTDDDPLGIHEERGTSGGESIPYEQYHERALRQQANAARREGRPILDPAAVPGVVVRDER